jgi:hypothetical protein
MGLEGAIQYFFIGGIAAVILLSFLSVTVPIAQETIDNADAGVFAMAEGSKLMLGLIGFVFVAAMVYGGLKEMLAPNDRTRIEGYG